MLIISQRNHIANPGRESIAELQIKAVNVFLLPLALVLLQLPPHLYAQTSLTPAPDAPYPEAGTPFIQNFSYKEYHAHPQNWAIVQDDRGILYFGNTDGLVTFDGVYWRLFQLPNKSPVSGLAVDKSRRIFVGARNEGRGSKWRRGLFSGCQKNLSLAEFSNHEPDSGIAGKRWRKQRRGRDFSNPIQIFAHLRR